MALISSNAYLSMENAMVSITDLSGDPANPWKQYGYMGNGLPR